MLRHREEKLFNLGTQPIVNLLFYQRCLDLDKHWNVRGYATYEMPKSKHSKTFVAHWNGSKKPWMPECPNKEIWKAFSLPFEKLKFEKTKGDRV